MTNLFFADFFLGKIDNIWNELQHYEYDIYAPEPRKVSEETVSNIIMKSKPATYKLDPLPPKLNNFEILWHRG